MSRDIPLNSTDKCEICGAQPAWDFPWSGIYCSRCAGFEKRPTKKAGIEVLWGGEWIEPLRQDYSRHPRKPEHVCAKVVDRTGSEVVATFGRKHWREKTHKDMQ